MADMTFKRTGVLNKNGSVMGELKIGNKTWPTMERGTGFTYVRKGVYKVSMTVKTKGREVKCLCFDDSKAIWTHLIHDAQDDNHINLEGCIAPGLTKDEEGVNDSADAMAEVLAALGGYKQWKRCTIDVQNNMNGSQETKEEWIERRRKEKGITD